MVSSDLVIMRTVYHKYHEDQIEYDNPFAHKVINEYRKRTGESKTLDRVDITFHNNKEIKPKIGDSVSGKEVFLIHQYLGYEGEQDPNVGNMALFFIHDALKRARASRIVDVIPFQPYQRQDRKKEGRVAISAKKIARMHELDSKGIITFDMHAGQEVGFYEIYVADLEALPFFVEYFKEKDGIYVPVSPDTGGADRARKMRRLYDPRGTDTTGIAIIDKMRPKDGDSEVMYIVGAEHVEGKNAVIIDDMSDTGGTLVKGADALKNAGAVEVCAATPHPVLSRYIDNDKQLLEAAQRIQDSKLSELVVTDSIEYPEDFFEKYPKIRQISIAPLTAEAIKRMHTMGSISNLYADDV